MTSLRGGGGGATALQRRSPHDAPSSTPPSVIHDVRAEGAVAARRRSWWGCAERSASRAGVSGARYPRRILATHSPPAARSNRPAAAAGAGVPLLQVTETGTLVTGPAGE